MESPRNWLERRSAETDRELAECLDGLAHRDDAAELVREHPFAALGCGVLAGFLALRLLTGPAGKGVRRHLLRSTTGLAALAMKMGRRSAHAPRETGTSVD